MMTYNIYKLVENNGETLVVYVTRAEGYLKAVRKAALLQNRYRRHYYVEVA